MKKKKADDAATFPPVYSHGGIDKRMASWLALTPHDRESVGFELAALASVNGTTAAMLRQLAEDGTPDFWQQYLTLDKETRWQALDAACRKGRMR